jgi:ATP-binding cassette subfamily B protein
MSSTSSDPSRSSGAAYANKVDQDKAARSKAKSLRPLAKLWPFIRPYPFQLLAFLIFLILSALGSLAMSWIVKLIIDCGFTNGKMAIPTCAAIAEDPASALNQYFLLAGVFAVLFALAGALRFYFITRLGQRVIADIRKAVFNRLTLLSPSYFERVRTGEVLSRLTTDTTLVETVITGSVSFALRSMATITGALFLMFFISWKLALMVLAIAPAMILPLVLTGKKIKRYSRDSQDRLADASARAGEAISTIQTVQAYTQEAVERNRFGSDIEASYDSQRKRIFIQSALTALMFTIALTGIIGILNYGAWSVVNNQMSGGDIGQFVVLAFLAIGGASSLTETFTNLLRAAGAADRLVEILNETPVINAPDTALELGRAAGEIAFEDVNFAYPTRKDVSAISDLSFRVMPGETIALVGPSGAGKSTVFQLLLRFYDIQAGEITLDGQSIDAFDPMSLRANIAVVQQNTPLFSGTPAENIGYGRNGATQADIEAAAKAAFAHEFILALPQGYNSDLGEQGSMLSGGQRQRLANARAILRDAPILLLDEATSALDSESEQAVQKAFEQASKDRTTLFIAHRLSTVLKADRIIVLDKGRIVETGTHSELVTKNGLYARLAKIQFGQVSALSVKASS